MAKMKIWLVARPDKYVGYDEFDAFVCVARTEEGARSLYPGSYPSDDWSISWVPKDMLHTLNVTLLGNAIGNHSGPEVILASFNAG